VHETRVLRKILGPKINEVTGEWRRLHKGALYSVLLTKYYSGDQVMRWVGHVARNGAAEVHTGFLWVDLKEKDHLEDLDVDGRIILKWVFN
jgi:hypothetical protein